MMLGPTNPPRLPKELMVPIAVAAAALPRYAVGRVQSTGSHAWNDNPIKQKKTMVSARRSPASIAPAKLTDVSRIGTAVCQRRSAVRLAQYPLMAHQYAQRIAEQWSAAFGRRPAVHATTSLVSLLHRGQFKRYRQ